MKAYARLESGVVVELFETDLDISELFHKDLIWVELKKSDNVQVGDRQVGSAWVKPTISASGKILLEKAWRNDELVRADNEINKVQDGDNKAIGSVSDWRIYRKNLRAWPDSLDFPDITKRPVAPDATNQ